MNRKRIWFIGVGALILLLGAVSLIGWVFDVPIFKTLDSGLESMKFNTAIGFVLLGSAFVMLQLQPPFLKLGRVLAFISLGFGLVSFFQDVFNYNLGIDEFFISDKIARTEGYHNPGRIATNASINFIFLSTALLVIKSKFHSLRITGQYLLQLVVVISSIAIVGYLYDVPAFYKFSFLSTMALYASLSFLLLAGTACFVNPTLGVVNLFLGDKIGNVMARQLVPWMFLMLLVLGLIGNWAYHHNFIAVDFGIALFTISFSGVGLFLIAYTARHLNKTDKKRTLAEKKVRELNASLEATVQQRTEELLESNRQNKTFVDQAPLAIAMVDLNMKYLAASQVWIQEHGLEDKVIVGKSYYEIFPQLNEEFKAIHKECLKGKVDHREEFPLEREDGSIQWITWDIRPWYLSEGRIGGLLIHTRDMTKEVEREMERKRLHEIVDKTTNVARIGAWEVDLVKNKVIWSAMTKKIHEVPADYEPELQTAINFFKEGESRERITHAVSEAIEKGIAYDVEVLLITHQGKEVWARAIGQAEEVDGKRTRLFGVFQDIDQRKRHQNELQNSESQFRGAFEHSAIGMALVSLDGQWLKVNAQVPAMLGYTEEELKAKTFQEITHPEDLNNDLAQVKELLKGSMESYQMEKRYFHKDGSIVWVLLSVSLLRDAANNPVHFISQLKDITTRKIADQEIRALNQRMTAIFDSGTQVSIIGTDTNGLVTYFSKGSETLLGYTEEEVVNLHTPAIFHVKEEVVKRGNELTQLMGKNISGFGVFIEIPTEKKFESREWTYVRKDGSRFPVQLVVTAMRDETSAITGYLGIATDITDRKEAQKHLEEMAQDLTNRNTQLASFAHITSHNLRAPVSNLNSLLSIYKTMDDVKEKEELFIRFEKVIHHLSNTLNELIEALKIKENTNIDREELLFEDILQKTKEIITAQIAESKAKIVANFVQAPAIKYNRPYLESIFQNLLGNAIKYSSPKRTPEIHLKTFVSDSGTVFTIQDNGLGIDLERHGNKVFGLHKTFHRHAEAKGVGLFITKTQVEAMGGRITVDSKVDEGTIFTIYFENTP